MLTAIIVGASGAAVARAGAPTFQERTSPAAQAPLEFPTSSEPGVAPPPDAIAPPHRPASRAGLWVTLGLVPVSLAILWKRDVIRPGSLARARTRPLSALPWTIWLAGAALVYFSLALGGGLAVSLSGAAPPEGTDPLDPSMMRARGIGALGGYALAMATAAWLMVVIRRRLDFNRQLVWLGAAPRDLIAGTLAMLLVFPIIQAMTFLTLAARGLFSPEAVPEVAHATLESLRARPESVWVWVQVGAAVLAAPIVEEVIFRVMLQTAVLRITGRAWVAIAVSSVVFGASHVFVSPWYAWPSLTLLGAALGLAFERSRSVGVPVVMHLVFNAANVVLAAVG